jgi:LysM repeat protein
VVYEHKIRYHKVKKGETLTSIARKYGTTKAEIMEMNGMRSEKLKIGQTIKVDKTSVPVSTTQNGNTSQVADSNVANVDSLQTQPELLKIRHTVKAGETLFAISQIYLVSIDDLVKWNSLPSAQVYIGQVLVIYTSDKTMAANNTAPNNQPPKPNTPAKKYHSVKSGETLSVIARKYGTTVAAIQKLNPRLNANKLQIGQKIRVK